MKAKFESSYDECNSIPIVDKNGNIKAVAIIDYDDLSKLSSYKWTLSKQGYAKSRIGEQCILMHRIIMDCPLKMVVDHVNHNKLDNRKNNLRVCTVQQNLFNSKLMSKSKSGVKGVSYNKILKRWQAYITLNYKKVHIGWYSNKEEAEKARRDFEIIYQGEYAYEG